MRTHYELRSTVRYTWVFLSPLVHYVVDLAGHKSLLLLFNFSLSNTSTSFNCNTTLPRIIRLMGYLHVLRVLHSSSAGPNWAETGYKINDITWFVNVVAFLAPNSKTLSVLKLPLNLQPRWIDFVCQQRHRPWKSGVLCLAKCTSSSTYTWGVPPEEPLEGEGTFTIGLSVSTGHRQKVCGWISEFSFVLVFPFFTSLCLHT